MFQALWTNIMHHNMTSLYKSTIQHIIHHMACNQLSRQFYSDKTVHCAILLSLQSRFLLSTLLLLQIWATQLPIRDYLTALCLTSYDLNYCSCSKMHPVEDVSPESRFYRKKTQTFQTRPFHFTINIKTVIHKQPTL